MGATPFIYDVEISADGTPEYSVDELLMEDGSPFPWADYAAEYAVSASRGCHLFKIDQSSGIAIDTDQNSITFTLPSMPACGSYEHALRFRHLATGKLLPWFDGSLTILEGSF